MVYKCAMRGRVARIRYVILSSKKMANLDHTKFFSEIFVYTSGSFWLTCAQFGRSRVAKGESK